MESLNEYIKEYKEYVKAENKILKTLDEKRKAYEKSRKKDIENLNKIRNLKSKLNNKSIKRKMLSVSIDDLLKELANISNSSIKNINLSVETEAVFAGVKKKTMKQMLDLINAEKWANLEITISDNNCENPYIILLTRKLDIFEKLSNKEKLADYFYLTKEIIECDSDENVFTKLCIKEKAWNKIMYNFSFDEFFLEENELLQKAILNCLNKKEEKVK